mmetsp:Transcript_3510/g.7250  ORF Transcript_3510/g.7250 Transcript_3510/m.7250 type:complete len:160 (-) Transcript_3510:52-531(-)
MPTLRYSLCVLGIVLSAYAVYVEHRTHTPPADDEDPFVALCDIEYIGASCSSTFNLPQGKLLSYFGILPPGHMLDVPNALLGIIYYIVTILLDSILGRSSKTRLIVACAGMSVSIYLATVLTLLKEFCIVCWSTHLINLLLLISALRPVLKSVKKMKNM